MRAERVGVAQAGAQVVRIGHAVEDEQQRGFRERFQNVDQREMCGAARVDDGDHALMARRACELASAGASSALRTTHPAAFACASRSRARASLRASAT